jgi:hypothetical protein
LLSGRLKGIKTFKEDDFLKMINSIAKIRCPECKKVYSINNGLTGLTGKRTAKCVVCDKKFFIEFRKSSETANRDSSEVTFLRSFFEKRDGRSRRKATDRRRIIKTDDVCLKSLSYDVIPIFDHNGDAIIGHISPGRREGRDRRSGIDRRRHFSEQ